LIKFVFLTFLFYIMKYLPFIVFLFLPQIIVGQLPIDGLRFWATADSSITVIDNHVATWTDISGNGYVASQANSTYRPLHYTDEKLEAPSVLFDGVNDFLVADAALLPANGQFSVFFVAKSNSQTKLMDLLGQFVGGNPGRIVWGYNLATNNNFWGAGAVNYNFLLSSQYQMFYIINDGDSNGLKTFYNKVLKNTSTLTQVAQTNTTLGNRSASLTSTTLNGSIFEIIIYDRTVNELELAAVEQYLLEKYAKPIDFGDEIVIENSFCPVIIEAPFRFESLTWSNGSTSQGIEISLPGYYSVFATDVFGFTSSTEFYVSFPSKELNVGDQVICYGDSVHVFPLTPDPHLYSFEWSTGATDSLIVVTEPGDYWVRITDQDGCFVYSDTISVFVDYFSTEIDLGSSLELCSGNVIGFHPDFFPETSFIWSTGDTMSSIPVYESGTYSITAVNSNGCTGQDEVFVEIIGNAPLADFLVEPVCLGEASGFVDFSVPDGDDEIISWFWDFGDGNTSTLQNPSHVYDESGSFDVTLVVEAASSCTQSLINTATVLPVPEALFSTEIGCVNSPVNFIDQSEPPLGQDIIIWLWAFGDGSNSNEQNPTHEYTTSGVFEVSLTVTSENECNSNFSSTIQIVEEAFLPEPFTLVTPSDATVFGSNEIAFSWNSSANASRYHVEISLDNTFSEIVLSESSTKSELTLTLPHNQQYFWRVVAQNICGDILISSNTSALTVLDIESIPSIALWLMADSVVANPSSDGSSLLVSSWLDLSGNNLNAIQNSVASQPNLALNVAQFNNRPSVVFDGVNDFLGFSSPAIPTNANYSFFIVFKNSGENLRDIFSQFQSNLDGRTILGVDHPSQGYFWFQTPPSSLASFQLFNNVGLVSITNNGLPNGLKLYDKGEFRGTGTSLLTADVPAAIGSRSPTNSQNPFNGKIFEVIIFNEEFENGQRELVEAYLRFKYSPPVNLSFDKHIPYGFCPIILDAGERFVNYQWSTGDTTQTIAVQESGTYSVTVTDIFGFVSSDEVVVRYPQMALDVTETTICLGEEIELGIGGGLYAEGRGLRAEGRGQRAEGRGQYAVGSRQYAEGRGYLEPGTNLKTGETSPWPPSKGESRSDDAAYSFLWSTGETTPSITVSEAGTYTLMVMDTLGCYRQLTATVAVDAFAEEASLGEPRPFCMGDELGLVNGGGQYAIGGGLRAEGGGYLEPGTNLKTGETSPWPPSKGESVTGALNLAHGTLNPELDETSPWPPSKGESVTGTSSFTYLWSTGATTPTIVIHEPGEYGLIVTNPNGCVAEVSTTLSFQGYAPEVAFAATTPCFGEPSEFTSLATVEGSDISSLMWQFGDPGDDFAEGSGPQVSHTYSQAGVFEAVLLVESAAGCSRSLAQPVQVYHNPEAWFTPNNACHNAPVRFLDATNDPEGQGLSQWEWHFGDGTNSHEAQPVHAFSEPGYYTTQLMVTAATGCRDTISRSINVRQSPDIAFSYTTACIGEAVYFTDQTTAPAWAQVTHRLWEFGDGNTSTQLNPSHFFPNDGIFPVSLTVQALNGCVISLMKEVTVHSMPEVSFAGNALCANSPFRFMDQTTVPNAQPAQWQWDFAGQGTAHEQHPWFTFSEAGQYPVSLTVTSDAGCTDGITQLVDVYPSPEADFSFFPRFGVSPLTVHFSNLSQGAASYTWDFGDGSAPSTAPSPSHTYTANGIYHPTLVAYTNLGCPDTTAYQINVIPMSVDVAVTQLSYQVKDHYLQVTATLMNLGTRDLDSLWLDLSLSGRPPVREAWTGTLRGGDIASYTFRAQLPMPPGQQQPDYLCVQASIPGIAQDDNPDNDRLCIAFDNSFRLLTARPNPAHHEVTIGFVLPSAGPVTIAFYDLHGHQLGQGTTTEAPEGISFITLPITHLRHGTYLYRVTWRDSSQVGRVVKY
jgi:PKD repeat protein